MTNKEQILEEFKKKFVKNERGFEVVQAYPIEEYEDWLSKIIDKTQQDTIEETREKMNIIWICVKCAEYFGKRYYPKRTNISTQVERNCEGCGLMEKCMHIRSYDD